jgi:hypothetical protein
LETLFEIVKYLGKFHPLVLHLPIGSLLMTFLLVVISKLQKSSLDKAIRIGIDFSFFGAVTATILGYFLSLDDTYDIENLKPHFFAGLITLFLTFSLCISHRLRGKENLFISLFVMTLIALSITGHKGAMITHGEDYLVPEAFFEEPQVEKLKDSIHLYEKVVSVILEDKCVSCHNASKSKNNLRLDSYDLIMRGGNLGSLFDTDQPEKGLLIKYISLPMADKLHMPPKNKAQLSDNEKWLLNHWVNSGAYKKSTYTKIDNEDLLKNQLISFLGLERKVKQARGDILAKLVAMGFRVNPNAIVDNFLKVKFIKTKLKSEHIKFLTNIKQQLVELDLSNSSFNDEMASTLADFQNLRVLRLDRTAISDKALSYLHGSELKVLNICNTSVTFSGVSSLLKFTTLKKLYAWNTDIKDEGKTQLAALGSGLINFGTSNLFSEKLSLRAPEINSLNNIFDDSTYVSFEEPQIKNINIHFTTDGSEPNKNSSIYKKPIKLNNSSTVKAKSIKDGWLDSSVEEVMFFKNNNYVIDYKVKSKTEKKYSISHKIDFTYVNNEKVIFDNEKGYRVYKGTSIENAKTWMGFYKEDFVVDINLRNSNKINFLTLSMLENLDMMAIFPKRIEIYGFSNNKWIKLNEKKIPLQIHPDERISYFKDFTLPVSLNNYNKVRIIAVNYQKFPNAPVYQLKRKKNSWIFIDELIFW